MSTTEILSLISIVTTAIVGIVLSRQIKSQKDLINQYKEYIQAVDPSKIIQLHQKEIEQINKITEEDIKSLKYQVAEMGIYIDDMFTRWENEAKQLNEPEVFKRKDAINMNFTYSCKILEKIHVERYPKNPNAK